MTLLKGKTLSKLIACAGLATGGLGFLVDVSGLLDCKTVNIYSFEYESKPSIVQHVNFVLCYSGIPLQNTKIKSNNLKFIQLEKYTVKY